jgi:hypothetical protein
MLDRYTHAGARAGDPASDPTDALLDERGRTHGDFHENALVIQELKRAMRRQGGWSRLDDCQAAALDMIAHKIGRILAGDPNHADHWDDIAGYARLVSRRVG